MSHRHKTTNYISSQRIYNLIQLLMKFTIQNWHKNSNRFQKERKQKLKNVFFAGPFQTLAKMTSIVEDIRTDALLSVKCVIEEEDLPFEEEILRNPLSLKAWLRYIDSRKDAIPSKLNMLYERALKELPGSYKLWYLYLRNLLKQVRGRCVTDSKHDQVSNCFERALVFMHKMPRIWMMYCEYVSGLCKVTKCRRIFDRALRALPATQHIR